MIRKLLLHVLCRYSCVVDMENVSRSHLIYLFRTFGSKTRHISSENWITLLNICLLCGEFNEQTNQESFTSKDTFFAQPFRFEMKVITTIKFDTWEKFNPILRYPKPNNGESRCKFWNQSRVLLLKYWWISIFRVTNGSVSLTDYSMFNVIYYHLIWFDVIYFPAQSARKIVLCTRLVNWFVVWDVIFHNSKCNGNLSE